MSKRSEYAARADACRRLAADADGRARLSLLKTEAEWRRLAVACYDTAFGADPKRPSAATPCVRLGR